MERNYPAAGFGDLGAGTGWNYDRSAKASVMYGSSRSSHPDSELLHRQAYGTPHSLQGYATNHHTGGSRQGGAWGGAGHTLGLSGLFDASLHHASPSGPDPSVMNLISALESRGPQPPPSASSLLSQFRTASWQTAMHTPAPAELFISGALPSSSSFPSSSALSAYQHPGSFSGRSFTPSLSLQDTSTFSPTSNGLLSPHDPLLHIKTPSQSSLGFDRLLSSQSASQTQATSSSSSCHLPPPQFNLLSSQLHNQSSQLYNASMFSSASALPPTPPPELAVSRQDSVIKHYQRSSPAQSAPLPPQQYVSCGGSPCYQQIASHHRHSGVPCSPIEEQSPISDSKPSPRIESKTYQPIIQTPYTSSPSSSSTSSSSGPKGAKSSGSSSGYSSSGSASSSSRTPHTPPSASSTSSSSSKTSTGSLSAPSHQQPPPQSATATPPLPVVSSTHVQQPTPKHCLSTYGSPSVAKSSTGLPDQTPPQQHAQSHSPSQPPPIHMAQSYGSFNSPHAQDLSSGATGAGGEAFPDTGSGGRSFSAEIVFGESSFGSASLRREGSPSLGYGGAGGSTGCGPIPGAAVLGSGVASAGTGSRAAAVGNGGNNSYHLPESCPSPSINSTISCPGLHSPDSACHAQSPGGSGATKYMSSMLSPSFMSSPQVFSGTQQAQSQPYHSTPPQPKTKVEQSQGEEEDDDDFLIHHLLHTQSSTPHASQHHPPSQQLTQSLAQARDGESKGMTYEMSKISEDRYHLQSVIRTSSTTSSSGNGTAIDDAAIGLNSPLEISQKKQQQTESKLNISKSTAGGVGGVSDSFSLSHQQQHESLDSVVHYGSGDRYTQHPHSQHSHHTSHHNHPHSHSHSQPHMELKKPSDANDNAYLCNTPDVQHAQQNHISLSLMDSPSDPPQQTQMPESVLCTNRTKIDPHQPPSQQQQHPLRQQSNESSQLQLQLQTQGMDIQYSLGGQQRDGTQAGQNSVSPLEMLEQSLSRTNSRDNRRSLDRTGVGVPVTGGEGVGGDRHEQQHRLTPHHHPQQTTSDIHDFLSEPDLGLSTPAHLHHLSQRQAHHQPQARTHHQLSHSQLAHPLSHRMAANMATPQQQPQQREPVTQLSHSQIDQLKQHQFDPVGKEVQHHAQHPQRFAPLTSICFPDSLLQDEDRPFFPEMEDIFCSAGYKSSCAGDSGAGQAAQESLTQHHGQGQEGMKTLKTGVARESYDIVGHHNDQGYGQYCNSLPETGNNNLHSDLDSLKTHKLPSTVNTDQLGLIQSQTLAIGLSSTVLGDGSVNKIIGAVGVGGSCSTPGLTSPIFCSSRPKKLLKTSSFHLLKQRREPQPQTKKNYAQEYEFEDDEDKADVPADIRLNSRRHPDLLPDLVSSCRKAGGVSGVSGLSPLISDMDFCHSSNYPSLGHSSQPPSNGGPKKRGRKPTKPKREGPPRPRGRPRIRPLPEPPYCRGLVGSVAGESRRGRGRGRGREQQHHHHEPQQQLSQQPQQDPIRPMKIKLPIPDMLPSESLLRTDSLSSIEPAFSDGSVGSAPSLGPSPGPSNIVDISRNDLNSALLQADEKAFDLKPGFITSFLDFLKTGKKQTGFEHGHDGGEQEALNSCFSLKGEIRPLTSPHPPLPQTPPLPPTGTFSEGGQGEGADLALSSCPSPCKPLDEELKGNLETLPSFSSDEEDSVSKNQDLQKSISSAISALYDTPHTLAAAMASAMVKAPPTLSTPTPPPLTPPLPAIPPLIPSTENGKEEHSFQRAPTAGTSPPPSTSPPAVPSSPLSNLPLGQSIPPPSTTPPPSSSDQDQEPDVGQPSPFSPSSSSPSSSSSPPPSPPTPEEAPASQRLTSLHLAKKQADAAIAGESEEEDSESGGEGIFRERDEFVVRTEDIGTLKMALQTGREPPPIWRVQKALLQKFSPEIKDGQRQFCATSNYLGYFGDAKMRYQRLYVKFLENVNKKDYVRVCSRKPWHRAGLTLRRQSLPKQLPTNHNRTPPQVERDDRDRERQKERELKEQREKEQRERENREKVEKEYKERQRRERLEKERKEREKQEQEGRVQKEKERRENEKEKEKQRDQENVRGRRDDTMEIAGLKEDKRRREKKMECQTRAKTSQDNVEPPPKKRMKWLKVVQSSSDESDSSPPSDEDGPVQGGADSRAMREMFRSYVEMLVSTALDPDMIQALQDTDDELYLPPMRRIDSLLSEQKRRLLRRVNMSAQHQEALHIFPRLTADTLESGAVKVHLGGEGYNRKTLNWVKRSIPKQQDLKLSIETCRIYSLYHSLHHFKYHTFLHCKKETHSIEQAAEDPGQEEVVQQCMANQGWLESLYNSFMELLSLSAKA
uniref:Proline rich 12 n=1 Tax=Sparus aurata TaxID=8175 RepID=A0A671VBZ7_SPAAU